MLSVRINHIFLLLFGFFRRFIAILGLGPPDFRFFVKPTRHSDLDCRIVSKKDFQTSFLGQEYLIV